MPWRTTTGVRVSLAMLALLQGSMAPPDTWSARAADPPDLRTLTLAVVSIETTGARGRSPGSGVIVSDEGHVVTTWSTVAGTGRSVVRGHDGSDHEVRGVAAADRGLGLVLLATEARPGGPRSRLIDRQIAIGETVHAIGGPRCAPLFSATDRIDALESGERFIRGLPSRSSTAVVADQCRIVHHAYLPRAASGGGLFTDDGLLVGVLVESPEWNDAIHVAIHAGHVAALLAAASTGQPRPLSSLDRFPDDPPPRDAAALEQERARNHLPPFDGDAMLRGGALRGRLRALRMELAALPAERRRIAARGDRWTDDAKAPQQLFEQVQRQIAENRFAYATMEPELEIRGGFTSVIASDIVLYSGVLTRLPRDFGDPTGQNSDTARAFSVEQRLVRDRLDAECRLLEWRLSQIDAERLRLRSRAAQSASDAAAVDRLEAALLGQVFFAGDPFGTRDRREVVDALVELDAEIAEGRPAGVFLLVRGLWYTRLGRWADALADFERIVDEDRAMRPAAALAAARCRALRDGRATVRAERTTRGDPILDALFARIALDAGDWSGAHRWLHAALEHGGDEGTIHEALARLAILADRDPRVAMEHARLASRAALGGNFRAWGLRALASAAGGDWTAAEETLAAGESLATGPELDRLRAWSACVRDRSLPGLWFER